MPRRTTSLRFGAVPLVRPLAYTLGPSPNQGRSPFANLDWTARQSLASHQAAQPEWWSPVPEVGSWAHISRRSRSQISHQAVKPQPEAL